VNRGGSPPKADWLPKQKQNMSPFQRFTKVKHELKRPNKLQSFLKPEILNISVLCLIAIMGAFYLVQVNRATTKGYEIRDLEKRINVLEEDTRKAELEVAELQSLDSIEQRMETLGMVPVERIQYVKVPGTVAVK
jgi:hypothetical protein